VAPVKQVEPKKDKKLDLSSESAFPSLSASASPRTPAFSGWSATASRVKAQPTARSRPMAPASGGQGKKASATQITDVLELPANQQISNLPNKPLGFKNSADVIQQVINKTGTNIIASTNRSGTTTFLIQGAPTDVARAKRELVAGLVVKVTNWLIDLLEGFFFIYRVILYHHCSVLLKSPFPLPPVVSSLVLRVRRSSRLSKYQVLVSISHARRMRYLVVILMRL
jgi:hypothetical protein